MVAPGPLREPEVMHMASGHALMSLLREGGQWDEDDDLRITRPGPAFGPGSPRAGDTDMLDVPKSWSLGSKPSLDADKWDEARPDLPAAVSVRLAGSTLCEGCGSRLTVQLQHFTSPIGKARVEVAQVTADQIAVSEVHPVGPLQIRIEREVHRDV